MKLASLRSGRDGRLLVVHRDLSRAVLVPEIAPTLQAALDDWKTCAPALRAVYTELCHEERPDTFSLDPQLLAAPLPRAYQWADASAYVRHVELVRRARGAEMPARFWTDPLMYQGGSDHFLGPRDPIEAISEAHGIDLEAEIGIITTDVPMCLHAKDASAHIALFVLINDVSLRNLVPAEIEKGFGFFHSKPASAFSPVAVTPDELGEAWDGHRVHLPLVVHVRDEKLGAPNAGVDMTFDFPTLIAHAAATRQLGAGCVIGSGTVSNADPSVGSCCLAERRMLEQVQEGKAHTPFLRFGDSLRIEMFDSVGRSIFGAIEQQVVAYHPSA